MQEDTNNPQEVTVGDDVLKEESKMNDEMEGDDLAEREEREDSTDDVVLKGASIQEEMMKRREKEYWQSQDHKNRAKSEKEKKREKPVKNFGKQSTEATFFAPPRHLTEGPHAKPDEETALRLDALPIEVLKRIFSYLTVQHWSRLARVSKMYFHLINEPSTWERVRVWKLWYKVDFQFVRHLSKRHAHHMKTLDLSYSRHLNDKALTHLAQACSGQKLSELRLNFCTRLTDQGLISLIDNVKLHAFSLVWVPNVTDKTLINMGKMWCDSLEVLNIAQANVTDKGILALARGCSKLKALNLEGCSEVTDESIGILLSSCTNLLVLNLSNNLNISNSTLHSLSNCPSLKKCYMIGCEIADDEYASFKQSKPRTLKVKR